MRLLPDFIIIGVQRCGTTSLYCNLVQHPNIFPAFVKEVHFFDIDFIKGINWYRPHFPSRLYKYYITRICKQGFITGEASPSYIIHRLAKRISKILPRVKIIILLRNPIYRAYSHYCHQVRKRRETLSFKHAIEKEAERLNGEAEKILQNENYNSFNHRRFSYLARGIYVDQLKSCMII